MANYPYRAKIHTTDIFGNPITIEGKIISEAIHGYNLPSGGWGLYGKEEDGDTPAVFIQYIPKGKRKPKWMNLLGVEIELLGGE